MLRLFLSLLFLTVITDSTISQYRDPRLLWHGVWPDYNYLGYPNNNPPLHWGYERNPPFLFDGISGLKGKGGLQNPNDFRIYFQHDSRFLWKNYGIPSPLLYMGVPNGQNPVLPWYFEPNIPGGGVVQNIGPTLIIEFHIGKALQTPISTPFGDQYIDQGYYPYEVVQILVPWFRLLFDRENQYLFGVLRYASTWTFSNNNFSNIGDEWIGGGSFSTNSIRPLQCYNEVFTTGRSPWLQDGDSFVCQAKVTYLFPYNKNHGLSVGNYDAVWDITFWTNPIFLVIGE